MTSHNNSTANAERPLRVAMVTHVFPALSETFVTNQVAGLVERGHEVHVFAQHRGDSQIHPDVDRLGLLHRVQYFQAVPDLWASRVVGAIRIAPQAIGGHLQPLLRSLNVFANGRDAASLRLFYTAMSLIKSDVFDIVHCQFASLQHAGMALKKLNGSDTKLVIAFRGRDISAHIQSYGPQVYGKLFAAGDAFLPNCDFFRERLLELGCPAHQISVVRSGVDPQSFPYQPAPYEAGDTVRLLSVGRLVEKKGMEYSLRAVGDLIREGQPVAYTIVGDGPLRESLEGIVHDLGIAHAVHFAGAMTRTDVATRLQQSHLFLATSVTASDGDQDGPVNVLKEAMLTGLPVVASRHGGITELVEDGVSGYLVPERDCHAIAERLRILLADPERWEAMGQSGRAFVIDLFAIGPLSDRLESLYYEMLNGKTAATD